LQAVGCGVRAAAFNIIYGRPNRAFLRGKAVAVVYTGASLLVLFAGLIAGTAQAGPG
jgi:hypothetical protein